MTQITCKRTILYLSFQCIICACTETIRIPQFTVCVIIFTCRNRITEIASEFTILNLIFLCIKFRSTVPIQFPICTVFIAIFTVSCRLSRSCSRRRSSITKSTGNGTKLLLLSKRIKRTSTKPICSPCSTSTIISRLGTATSCLKNSIYKSLSKRR